MKQFKKIKNPLNKYGKPFEICENLTFERRSIWEAANSNLPTYSQKWIKNGKIFLKKNADSYPITITDREALNKLLQPTSSPSEREEGNDKQSLPIVFTSDKEPLPSSSITNPKELFLSSSNHQNIQTKRSGQSGLVPPPRHSSYANVGYKLRPVGQTHPHAPPRLRQQNAVGHMQNQTGQSQWWPRHMASGNLRPQPRRQGPILNLQQSTHQFRPRFISEQERPLSSFSHFNPFSVLNNQAAT